MDTCEQIARSIGAMSHQQRTGTLKFFGEWFGRPMDNLHTCQSCEAGPDFVVLHFNEGEKLTVWNPSSLESSLLISKASRVRWEWHSYGAAKTSENLFYLEYKLVDGKLTSSGNERRFGARNASPIEPAVELVSH